MFETTRFEIARRRRSALWLSVGAAVLTAFFLWYYSVLDTESLAVAMEALPPSMLEALNIVTLATIEGFLATELYTFLWVFGFGLYFAYSAGGLIADDIDHDRLDLLLTFPQSRARLYLEKLLAIGAPIIAINVTVGLVVYGGSVLLGEPIEPARVVLVHLLSIPYFAVCASIGALFSVMVSRSAIAQRAGAGVVLALFLVESVTAAGESYEWLGSLTPMAYYEPTPLLLEGTYDVVDTVVLLGATVLLTVVACWLFTRRDV